MKSVQKNCPNFNHKSLKMIIKIEERSSKNSSQNPQILSTSLSITCILCHAASLKILAQEFLCTANMIDSQYWLKFPTSNRTKETILQQSNTAQGPLNIWTEHSNCQIHSRGDSKNLIALLIPNIFLIFTDEIVLICI